ncbi:MAG TPA: 4-hydroxyphenylacetate 3-hydroxylase N-terminal domain-containing protein [Stellaceae bacterium]|jgi:4-hydroxyphenylacetate 3-monooxygenase|nr:4-hydroxyphenylacetate 3-hydroxylase N-terminal domain-containing protein [Stellaceae bacterium]
MSEGAQRKRAAVKTGADHLTALRDGREVYIDGDSVADVTTHPAFRNAVHQVAALYDYQARPENINRLTFGPTAGAGYARINRCWLLPRSHAELVERREAMTEWAEQSGGFLGRAPDHVASSLVGQVIGIDVFRRHGEARAQALLDYFDYVSRNDCYVSYVIINPQADRNRAWGEQQEDLVARIVDEDSAGITVRGAKMLGTGTIMANELLVANLQPLRPGEEDLAVSFAIPVATKGLKLLSRKSYEAHAVSPRDNPLSSRFDENDALAWFEDVKVPWERVFVHRDADMCRAQFHDTLGHTFQNYQSQIRLMVKVRFLVGIARRIADTIGTSAMPPVRETLGKLAAQAAMVEGMVAGMEAAGHMQDGYYLPNKHMMYAAQVLTQELYPKLIDTIRGLAGGALIMLPSSHRDVDNPELARVIGLTQQSPAATPSERVDLLKLAWDALGSEFGSRHTQYEMFYAGAPYVTRAHSYRTYDWAAADALVRQMLGK